MAGVVLIEDILSIPGGQIVSRVDAGILPVGDPEEQRPVAVLAVADATRGTMGAPHSGTERWWLPHACSEVPRLRKAGWFSRGADIVCELWTPSSAWPAGSLDDQTFTGRDARFL